MRSLWDARRKSKGVARGVGALVGGAAFGQVIMLAAYPLLTRLYSPDSFGILSIYAASLGILTVVGSLRFDQAIPLPRTESRAYALFALSLAIATLFATCIGIACLAIHLISPDFAPDAVLWLLPIGVFLGAIYQAFNMHALRNKSYKVVAQTRVSQALGSVSVQSGLGALGAGGLGLIVGHISGQSAGILRLAARVDRKRLFRSLRWATIRGTARRFQRFAWLGTPAALMNSASTQIPALMLAGTYGLHVAGFYLLASRVVSAPTDLVGRSTAQVFYAESAALGRKRSADIRRLLLRSALRLLLFGTIVALVLVVFGPQLFVWVFGDEWVEAGSMTRYLSVMMLMALTSVPASQVFLLLEKQHMSLALNGLKLSIAVGSLSIPAILGASATMTIAVYAILMASYYLVVLVLAVRLLKLEAYDPR